jgi:hypothetical protein
MRQPWKFATLSTLSVLVATAALVLAGVGTAASVTPTEVTGNITVAGGGQNHSCGDYVTVPFTAVGTSGPAANGPNILTGKTPGDADFTLTVTTNNQTSIDFSITGGIVLVAAVKGASSFNLYDYQPFGSTGDTNLVPPANGGTTSISHYVFCIGDAAPSAVAFRSASAVRSGHAVVVRWKTASEVDTLGFNVYRQVNGKLVHANKHLILVHGGTYSFVDRKAPSARNLRYRIAAVHADGSRSWFGPLVVKRQS